MSAAAINRPTGTRPSIFARPAIPLSKPMIRRRAGDGATSTSSCSTSRTGRRRISNRFRDTIETRARRTSARRGVAGPISLSQYSLSSSLAVELAGLSVLVTLSRDKIFAAPGAMRLLGAIHLVNPYATTERFYRLREPALQYGLPTTASFVDGQASTPQRCKRVALRFVLRVQAGVRSNLG